MLPPHCPPIGLGTAGVDDPALLAAALDAGYRFVDTAQRYGNEAAVGEALERAAVDREEVFIATKVHERNLAYEDVLETTAESCDRLGLDVIDLLYVHWPLEAYDPPATLRAFDELHENGTIRHVGVSNFTPDRLREATAHLDAPIAANQVECHPLLPQTELREYTERGGIQLVAYAPLMKGAVGDVPELVSIAEKHDVSPAQISLAWIIAKGVVPIPRGDTSAHIRENFAARDLELDDEDMATLDGIERTERVYPNEDVWPEE